MNRDEIIRSFLDLHPDTPIDMKEYAIPLRIISRMLEAGAAAEREACAEACNGAVGSASMYDSPDSANFAYGIKNHCQELIRERGQS